MARGRTVSRDLERALVRAARRQRPQHGAVRRAAADPQLIADRFEVVSDWRRVEDGRAARLGPRERIDLRGRGRFAATDPGRVVVGWRSPGRAGGLLLWAGVVGASWWLGGRGRGSLAPARSRSRW